MLVLIVHPTVQTKPVICTNGTCSDQDAIKVVIHVSLVSSVKESRTNDSCTILSAKTVDENRFSFL